MADYKITYEDGTTGVIVADEKNAKIVAGNGSYELVKPPEYSDEYKLESKKMGARIWRNKELNDTDKFVPLTDHSDHTAIMAYRVKLRNWPADADNFPDTKPTIGS